MKFPDDEKNTESPDSSFKRPSNKVFSPSWLYSNNTKDLQGYPAVQAPLFDGRCHDEPAEKEKIGFEKVLRADLLGRKDPQRWEEADREHGRDGQRKGLCAPIHSHQHHHVETFSLLKR